MKADIEKAALQAAKDTHEVASKPTFDVMYVERLFEHYAENRSGHNLVEEWQRGAPTLVQVVQGATWLLEIGFNDSQKEDVVAETIVKLVKRKCLSWEALEE